MSKARFGIAAALALGMAPAWAGDEKAEEKVTRDAVASREIKGESESERSQGTIVAAGKDTATMKVKESNEARASHEERWLREREGYRDGGY